MTTTADASRRKAAKTRELAVPRALPGALRGSGIVVLAVAIVAAGCGDEQLVTAPRAALPDSAAVEPAAKRGSGNPTAFPDEVAPVPGRYTAFVGAPVTEWTGVGPVNLGAYETPTWVEVEIRGFLDVYHAYPPEDAGRRAARLGPGGRFERGTCNANVTVDFDAWGRFAPCKSPRESPREIRSNRLRVHGTARAERRPGPHIPWERCGEGFEYPCFSFEGGQTVTITPVARDLIVAPDTNDVTIGDTIVFTASTLNGRSFEVREWIWVTVAEPDEPSSGASSADTGQATSALPGGIATDVCGPASTCTHVVDRTGTMYVRAFVSRRQIEQASATIRVEPPSCVDGELAVARASGPNPGGSFTSRDGENRVLLEAELSGGCQGYDVRWDVEDSPDDAVSSPSVEQSPTGSSTGFDVRMPEDAARWPDSHRPLFDQKALAYRVRADIDVGGRRVETAWKTVRQSDVDVIRQEYVEFDVDDFPRVAGDVEPTPTLPVTLADGPVFGDYDDPVGGGLSWVRDELVELTGRIADLWTWGDLRAVSAYRNPVHHVQHTGRPRISAHQVGAAIDLEADPTAPTDRDDAELQQHLYWTVLRNTGSMNPRGVCSAPYEGTRGTHVHLDVLRSESCGHSWSGVR